MKNRNTNTQKQMSLALVAFNLLAMVALNCQPAQAIVSDPGYIDQLQNRKRALQTREFYLMRDTDDLLRRKEDLKQKTDSDSVWQLNEVCRKNRSQILGLTTSKTRHQRRQLETSIGHSRGTCSTPPRIILLRDESEKVPRRNSGSFFLDNSTTINEN